jgi:RNA polymerase sigma factor (sigma-70 family)
VGATLDKEEAAALCESLYPRVFGALALYTGDQGLAEELTQDVMLQLWRSWPTVSATEQPKRWALRVGFNLAKSRWRRFRLERREIARSPHTPDGQTDIVDVLAVRAAVVALPRRQRAAVVLRYFNDLSVADTAAVLSCAEGTVKAHTSQAIAKLRSALEMEIEVHEGEAHE